MNEIETRIIKIDVDKIKDSLTKMGCERVKDENQENNIFDFPDRRLLNKKGYARIRIVEDLIHNKTVSYMTTKKLISQEKYKVMDEKETIIEDGSMGKDIFVSIGLELVQTIKKHRESFKYKNTLIEIDINDPAFCPFPYLEIESSSPEEINEVVSLLGYTMNDTTSKTIYEILNDEGNTKGL